MTATVAGESTRRLYILTGLFGLGGFVWSCWAAGFRPAFAFALGAACSAGNLWLFDWLSRIIAPGEDARKPWQAGTYVIRYVLLLGLGYAIVNLLNVSPLAVILGLLASTAAVLTSLILELFLALSKRS